MPLRFTRRVIVNLLQGTVLVILIATAGYISIGRILVSNVGKFRIEIEKSLSRRLNVDVHIGHLAGEWKYLDPTFTIDGLVIGNPAHPAIKIGHASARIDSLASFRELSLVVRNLYIAGLALSMSQREDDSWQVDGMPRGERRPFNADPLLVSVRYLHGVDISRVNIDVKARHRLYHITNQRNKPFELVQEGVQKTFYMPLSITHTGNRTANRFELLGRYIGDPRDLASFSANLYMRLPQIEVSDFLPHEIGGVTLNRIGLRGQLWLDVNHGEIELRGLPVINEISIRHNNKPVTLVRNLSATVAGSTWPPGDWQVHLADIKANIGDVKWQGKAADVLVSHKPAGWSWAAGVPSVDIAEVMRMVKSIGVSGDYLNKQNIAVMDALKPGGKLKDLWVMQGTGGVPIRLVALLDAAHVNPYLRAPGLSTLNGFISLTPNHGYVDIDNEKPFKVDTSMFPGAWIVDSAAGQIRFERSDARINFSSGPVRMNLGKMKGMVRVSVNLPPDPSNRTWGLEIGLLNTPVKDVHDYLPVTLSENLTDWLNRALKDGQIDESGMVFHGTLGKDLPKVSKSYELYFKARNTTLNYDPNWPVIDDMSGTVYVGDWGVETDDISGMLYQSKVTNGQVSMPAIDDEPATSLLINASIDGPLTDGIKILTTTPVAKATNDVAKHWIGSGDMRGTVKLNIPVGERAGEPAGVDVVMHLSGDNIMMADYNLDVLNIDGDFSYRSEGGLSSKAFTATLFNQPVKGNIKTSSGKRDKAISLSLGGKIDVKDLYHWTGQTLLSRASGITNYAVKLHIPVGEGPPRQSWIEARSRLLGVNIDLPPPMGKPADQSKSLVYRQTFLKKGYRIDLALGERTRASLYTRDGILRGGLLHFDESAMGKVSYDKIRVRGNLDYVDYSQWEKATREIENKSSMSLSSAAASNIDSIDVGIKQLKAFGLTLKDTHTHITRKGAAWNVQLKNDEVAGNILVPDEKQKPLDVALDYFHYKSAGGDGNGQADPMADVHPSEFVPIDFSTKELTLNGADYGNWAFRFRPDKNGALIEDLAANVKGLEIQPDARIFWDTSGKSPTSTFKGTVKVSDLGKALKVWGFASSIEGKDFVFRGDFAWPGSPANIGLFNLKGMVILDQGEGRFVQAEGGDALKLLGIFDFASLARRFRFDFSDIAKKGFSFSKIHGSARLDTGKLSVVSPIEIVGPSSSLKLGGTVNLKTGDLDNDMIVTLPVSRNLPWYAAYSAIATGPLAGAGVWLAQKIFGSTIDQMSSAKYKISGTMDKPSIQFVSVFNDKVRESAAEPEPVSVPPTSVSKPKPTTQKPNANGS